MVHAGGAQPKALPLPPEDLSKKVCRANQSVVLGLARPRTSRACIGLRTPVLAANDSPIALSSARTALSPQCCAREVCCKILFYEGVSL